MNTEREDLMNDLNSIMEVCRDAVNIGDWNMAAECWDRQSQIAKQIALCDQQKAAEATGDIL